MNDKTSNLMMRIVVGAILTIALLFMFVFNPGVNQDQFSNETLWEAVHPYHWFFDSLGMIGLLFIALYLGGVAGAAVYAFTGPRVANSSGMIHVVAAVSALLMLLFFA